METIYYDNSGKIYSKNSVYNNTDSLGQYQEYVGIIQWYIKKHLKRY